MAHFPRSVWHPVARAPGHTVADHADPAVDSIPHGANPPLQPQALVMARTRIPVHPASDPDTQDATASKRKYAAFAHATAIVAFPPLSKRFHALPMAVFDFASNVDVLLPTHVAHMPLSVAISCSKSQYTTLSRLDSRHVLHDLRQGLHQALKSILGRVATVEVITTASSGNRGQDERFQWIQLPNNKRAVCFSFHLHPLTSMHLPCDGLPLTHFTDPDNLATLSHISLLLPSPFLSSRQLSTTISILLLSHFARVFPRVLSAEFTTCMNGSTRYTPTMVQSLCSILQGSDSEEPFDGSDSSQVRDEIQAHESRHDPDAVAQLIYSTLRGQVMRRVWTLCSRRAKTVVGEFVLDAPAPSRVADAQSVVSEDGSSARPLTAPVEVSSTQTPTAPMTGCSTVPPVQILSPLSPSCFTDDSQVLLATTSAPPLPAPVPNWLVAPTHGPSSVALEPFPVWDSIPDCLPGDDDLMPDHSETPSILTELDTPGSYDDSLWTVSANLAAATLIPDPFESAAQSIMESDSDRGDLVSDPFRDMAPNLTLPNTIPDPFDLSPKRNATVVHDPFEHGVVASCHHERTRRSKHKRNATPLDGKQIKATEGTAKVLRWQTEMQTPPPTPVSMPDPFACANGADTLDSLRAGHLNPHSVTPDPFELVALPNRQGFESHGDLRSESRTTSGLDIAQPPPRSLHTGIAFPPTPSPSSPIPLPVGPPPSVTPLPRLAQQRGNARLVVARLDPDEIDALLARAALSESKALTVMQELEQQ